jgi:hypothetical protein
VEVVLVEALLVAEVAVPVVVAGKSVRLIKLEIR